MVYEFFSPRFGGTFHEWSQTNKIALTAELKRYSDLHNIPKKEFNEYQREGDIQWITLMFEFMGIEVPDDEEAFSLCNEAHRWIIPKVRSAYPGVSETIPLLHHIVSKINTASNETSDMLHDYFTGMNIRKYFSSLYGPDIVGIAKTSS